MRRSTFEVLYNNTYYHASHVLRSGTPRAICLLALRASVASPNGTYFSVKPLAILRFNSARGLVNHPQ
jgi:hypothetical protein